MKIQIQKNNQKQIIIKIKRKKIRKKKLKILLQKNLHRINKNIKIMK